MAPLPGPAAAPQPPRLLLLPATPPSALGSGTRSSSASPPPPRKRQRLAHLSVEEKALRRKLKNRVAAQSARDRKKARMGELERQAVELEAENQKLLAENQALRQRTLSLARENRQLRLRLGLPATETPPQSDLLLGILDSLDPDMFLQYGDLEPAYLEEVQQEKYGGEMDPLPASPPSPLGPSPPKLEAINELIRFDHEYTKPFVLEIASEVVSQANMLVRVENAAPFSSANVLLEPSISVKEESVDILLPELGISHLLSPDQKPLLDASSDSGYEGSPSPFSDLSSPLGTDYVWDEAFANELFPQLISV